MTPTSALRFFSLSLLGLACAAYADDTTAVYFAKQAGVIAGAAEACGQPVSMMVMRSGEIINALAANTMDNTYATAAFQKAQQDAKNNMIQSQNVSCAKVISDYNTLPLLQPDYQNTVLKPLLASAPPKATAPTQQTTDTSGLTASGAANTVPAATLPATQTPAPPTSLQSLPPVQNYVSGSNNGSNPNPAVNTPINPGYAPNNSQTPPSNANNSQQTELAKIQLAQQLAQMAQTLVTNNQTEIYTGPGVPSGNNPAFNSQLNEQLYGVGANNPLYTGAPLVNPPAPSSTQGK